MSGADDLVLSGGGSVAVATDALFAAVAELRGIADHADAAGTHVRALPPLAAAASPAAADADGSAADLAAAAHALRTAAERARSLAAALQRSAENYGELERRTLRLSRSVEGFLAERAGAWLPALLLPLLPAASAGTAGLLLGASVSPGGLQQAGRFVAEALRPHAGALTHPVTVALLRSLALASDDFGGGLVGVPAGLPALLGENALDVVGLPGSAALAVALATRLGALREGEVRLSEVRAAPAVPPPTGFRDRADRIPSGTGQIRIERYTFRTGPDRFAVYLGGTRSAAVFGGGEPWDMTSNAHAVAELSPASLRAAEEAMRRSGMTAESEVVFTGYSQGGLVATQLAASGDWNTRGLVTLGAPVARIELPGAFPAVQIEHTDDLVPAFGGDRTDPTALVVRREAFAGRDVPADVPVPAHGMDEYRATAELLDAARAPVVAHAAGRLSAVASGAERVEVRLYRAERVPER